MNRSEKKRRGRPSVSPSLKKNSIHLKLPRWLIEFLDKGEFSRAIMIETALKKTYKLKTPE